MAFRSGFSSRLGFVAAAAGSAVGLGNIWKFPFETGENGGAAFLVVYLACAFLIGFPIMVAEISLGRKAQLNPYGSYQKIGGGRWGLAGLFGITIGVFILSFYNVVAGWAFGYFVQTVFGDLLIQQDFGSYFGQYAADITDNFIYSLCFMGLTAIIVIQGVQRGIETASKILMPALFLILIGLIFYSFTLPNAMAGVEFYLVPDLSEIKANTIYTAMGQAFFSLSLGMGALITYGSYFSKREDIIYSAAIVTLADVSVAFLAGLLIFPLVFFQGSEPTAGPGLVFVALPGIFQSMGPVIGKVIGGSFFLLLCLAALTSTISLLEVPVAFLTDEKKWPRRPVVMGLAAGIFLLGIPSMLSQGASDFFSNFIYYGGNDQPVAFLDLINDVFSDTSLPLGGFILCLFVARRWKTANMAKEIASSRAGFQNSFLARFISFMITYFCPTILGLITLVTLMDKFLGVELPFIG